MTARHRAKVLGLELSLVKRLCESINTPRALTVWILIKEKHYLELVDLEIDPNHYLDHQSFADDYLVTKILSKNPRVPVSVNPETEALKKFWEAEEVCAETNDRLRRFVEDPHIADLDVLRTVCHTQLYIQRILGDLTKTKIGFAESKMRFGPGATTSLSGVVTQGKKYSHRTLDATPRVIPFRTFGFPEAWKSVATDIRPRRSSKMRIVPKKATCGRTICIEPDLNIFVQLGQGALIRKQLADYGLDLNTQKNNQELAREGSITDRLCTMDLSSASDLISREVVWLLLPYTWAAFLEFSRTDMVEYEGQEKTLNKWSSMGNGYTFELETLIFYGILLGAAEEMGCLELGKIIAYGDDLIFPSELESLVRRTLNFLGFKVNSGKTFGKGAFRESCGTDWFRGHNVRPYFLRSEHHDFPTTCYIIANGLSRWAGRHNSENCHSGRSRDLRLFPVWYRCLTAVVPNLRYRIPQGFGDVGFISNWDEARPSTRLKKVGNGWGGFTFRYRSVKAMMETISVEGCLLAALNAQAMPFSFGEEALRGRFAPARTGHGYTLVWPDLGPWS